ncbi:hypothetical protein [Cellulosimicrobium protaetiae]
MARRRAWRRDWGTTVALTLVAVFPVAVLGTVRTWRMHDRGELSVTGLLWMGVAGIVLVAAVWIVVRSRFRRELDRAVAANPGATVALVRPVRRSTALLDQIPLKQRKRQMPCLLVVRRDEVDLWSTVDPPIFLLRMEREGLSVELVALDVFEVEELLTLRLTRGDTCLEVAVQGLVGSRSWGHRGALEGLDEVLGALGYTIRPTADAKPDRPGSVAEQPHG